MGLLEEIDLNSGRSTATAVSLDCECCGGSSAQAQYRHPVGVGGLIAAIVPSRQKIEGIPAFVAVKGRGVAKGENGSVVDLTREVAQRKARFEFMERLASRTFSHDLVESEAATLGIEIERFLPFSDVQIRIRLLPVSARRTRSAFIVAVGEMATGKTRALVPAELICLNTDIRRVPLRFLSSSGNAAHTSSEAAKVNALLEMVERDVICRTYFSRRVQRCDPGRWVAGLAGALRSRNISVDLFLCRSMFQVPVFVALMHRGGRYVYIEAGHLCQTLIEEVESAGLGCLSIGALDDDACTSLVFDPHHQLAVIYCLFVGGLAHA
ncbi:YcaO-like family protein [Burkholderia ubonensis]|uniref:YcaO-like family protein n=1 Tax=Burkholderia ubonensis TaxID=101571 RepID=UPI000758599F|nr:YcaO-like family protein [Burkholderia ubonensis]KVA22180.1 hypothetical protein WI42_08475 [Burkholderia ubonensis]KVA23823.1 hypothetical protein WI43_11295 [Burkholderia ubonensis]KVA39488.1 hypothetical protein WI46_15365 [Burkholderia ubonensis]